MYSVYILIRSDRKLYTGVTGDLKRRLEEHKRGKVESTKNYKPIKLLLLEQYLLKSDAIRRERFLKTTEGKRLLRMQIRDTLQQEGYTQ